MNFRTHTLDNGLEIVAECNEGAHSQGLGFFVKTGSRDESDELAGVSHFLEHMVFKGTPRRSADDVNREFDELGAHYNAFTSEESTVYYAAVLPEYQEPTVDLLADIMRPSLREDDFEMEKKVIVEEIQMYADQPPFGMDDKIKELHYGQHPLARSVLGTVETVENLSADQMRTYFEARYSPSNLFVAAAGKVDFDALVKQVEQRCADWPMQSTQRKIPAASSGSSFHCVHRETSAQQYVLQLLDAPASESEDRYAAKLLATMFGDDSGSRLYWEMVDPGLAESASMGHYEYLGAGMYFLWMSCEPTDALDNFQRLVEQETLAQTEGFTAEELRQAQSKVKARIVLGSERPRNRLFNVGGNWMQRGKYRTVADDIAAVENTTLDDIHRVLAACPLTGGTTVTIGPLADWPSVNS
ncbi:MAG: pitrilysin family protein [Planctomycetota bacterium]